MQDLDTSHPARFRIYSEDNPRGCLHIGAKYVQFNDRLERTMQTALVILPLDETLTRFWVTSQQLYEYNAGRLTFRKDKTVDCKCLLSVLHDVEVHAGYSLGS